MQDAYWYEGGKPFQRYELAPPGSAAPGGIAAVSRITASMEVWWVGPTGFIEGAFWYEGGKPFQRYQLAPPGSAALGTSVYAQSRQANVMNVW